MDLGYVGGRDCCVAASSKGGSFVGSKIKDCWQEC
jgi:hypothetical protein